MSKKTIFNKGLLIALAMSFTSMAQAEYYQGGHQQAACPNGSCNPTGNSDALPGHGNHSDDALAKKIQDKLGPGWFSKGYDQVHVRVNNGVVLLQGTVKTREDKDKIEAEIRKLDGVKYLDNQLRVQEQISDASTAKAPVSDQEIAKKIQDKISSGMFSKGYDHVKAWVNNGVVILQGDVQTSADKESVEKSVRNIDGVRGVDSQIIVILLDNNAADHSSNLSDKKRVKQNRSLYE